MHTQAAIFCQFSRGSEIMAFHKRMAQFGQSIQHSCGLKHTWSHLSPKFQAASSEWVLASKSSIVHHKTRFSLVFVLKLDTLLASDLISELCSWTGHPQPHSLLQLRVILGQVVGMHQVCWHPMNLIGQQDLLHTPHIDQ